MATDVSFTATRIIESLRSGVPSAALAERMAIGRERLLSEVDQALDGGVPRPLVIRANYGDGKTHFLETVSVRAHEAGFVVSTVAVSREAPLAALDKFYPAVVHGTRLPDSQVTGLAPLLEKIRQRGTPRPTLEGVPQRLRLALEAYCQDDVSVRDDLLNEMSGRPFGAFGQLMKEVFARRVAVEPFKPSREGIMYFRFMDRLVTLAGYRGWVLLIDELELMGTTSMGQRAKAYANLAALCRGAGNLNRTVVVGALASNYYDDVIDQRDDVERAPAWLATRGRRDEAVAASEGLDLVLHAKRLPPLTQGELDEVLTMVRDEHALAYAWQPPPHDVYREAVGKLTKTDAPVRTRIRAAVQWLDLWMQYGHPPSIRVANPAGVELVEVPEGEDEGEKDPPGVRRPAIF